MKPQRTLSWYIKRAQQAFNAYIRERDKDKRCIGCGCSKIQHASHYFSAGKYPALKFNEDNVHGSCLASNYFNHGGLAYYRMELERRIGKDRMNLLESSATRAVHKWSVLELEAIYHEFKQKLKDLAV